MASRSVKNSPDGDNHNRIARAIFAAAESMGITDRKLLEELTGHIIQRLGPSPTLPGMEHLVPTHETQLPSDFQIEVAVKELLAEKNMTAEADTAQLEGETEPEVKKIKRSVKPVPKIKTKSEQEIELTKNARSWKRDILKKIAKGRSLKHPKKCSGVSPITLPRQNSPTTRKLISPTGKANSTVSWLPSNFCLIPRL